jgi:hypothetical protein
VTRGLWVQAGFDSGTKFIRGRCILWIVNFAEDENHPWPLFVTGWRYRKIENDTEKQDF